MSIKRKCPKCGNWFTSKSVFCDKCEQNMKSTDTDLPVFDLQSDFGDKVLNKLKKHGANLPCW